MMRRPISEHEQIALAKAANLPRPQDMADLPETDSLAREWRTYKREVGKLLACSEVGRFALVKGDRVVSIWDTHLDAIQAGRHLFGSDTFLVQEIQPYVSPIPYGYLRRCA
jgi:hypothetical protein